MLKKLILGLMLTAAIPGIARASDNTSSNSDAVSGSDAASISKSDVKSSNNSSLASGQSVTIESNTNVKDRLQAPPLTLVTPDGKAPCKESWGFGTSVPGVGFNINVPRTDKTCQVFAAHDSIKEYHSLAIEQANFMMLCSNFKPYRRAVADLNLDCAALAHSIGRAN